MKRSCYLRVKRPHFAMQMFVGIAVASAAGCLSGAGDPVPGEEPSAPADTVLAQRTDDALDADYVPVPHVGRAHKSCVHALADHETVDEHGAIRSADGRIQPAHPACAYPIKAVARSPAAAGGPNPTDNGWTEDAVWRSPVTMKQLWASFHVPEAPSIYTGQTIFFFPAMEDTAASTSIIQPVLQYGPSAAGGGAYWAAAAWFGGGAWADNYYFTPLRGVLTGEVIRGGIWRGACAGGFCEWNVGLTNSRDQDLLSIGVVANLDWRWVYGGAVEVYNVDDCRKYPATYNNFYDFWLQDGNLNGPTPTWTREIYVATCAEHVDIYGYNLVELHYGT
jgi:hypothetical protein